MSYRRFLLLVSVAGLASCAYAIDGHIQDVRIETPGARGSVCYAYVDGLRYRMHPPQTININNTREDLLIDCLAPGNRRKKMVVKSEIKDSAYLNAANAGLGTPWDAISGAAYKFPDVIEIDFTGEPILDEALPAANAPDIKQPEEYLLEEFGPGQLRLNSDRYEQPVEIKRRESRKAAPMFNSPEISVEPSVTSGAVKNPSYIVSPDAPVARAAGQKAFDAPIRILQE